jgi:hypothetical protein
MKLLLLVLILNCVAEFGSDDTYSFKKVILLTMLTYPIMYAFTA